MKRNKIFYNLIGIPIMAMIMLFAFSSKTEASIADFAAVVNNQEKGIETQNLKLQRKYNSFIYCCKLLCRTGWGFIFFSSKNKSFGKWSL